MNNIELLISESIKTGKWLDISYKNKQNETTYYWIAIKDIDLTKRILIVTIYNDYKSFECLDAFIKVDNILSAKILEFTTYEVPQELIDKIEHNKEAAKWLHYESFNNNILKYYLKCNELDNDPYQKESVLIKGIDKTVLLKNKRTVLDEEQTRQIVKYIKKYDYRGIESERNSLILSILTIEEGNKKYIVLYYDIYFNPKNKTLNIISKPRVNQSFLIKDKRHSISSYIDINPEEFTNNITNKTKEYYREYTELIRSNLRDSEIINQLPEILILQRSIRALLEPTYNIIEQKQESGLMERPLKAFFGNSNRQGTKRKEPAIVI